MNSPSLWKNFTLIISENNIQNLKEISQLRRFNMLQNISFQDCKLTNIHVELLSKMNLKRAAFGSDSHFDRDCDLTAVSGHRLAKFLANLQGFHHKRSGSFLP